jgi:hypothetical protein
MSFAAIKPANLASFQVRNISSTGLGLIHPVKAFEQKPDLLEGTLTLGSHQLDLAARVVHLSQAIVGCRFEGDVQALKKLLDEYFRVEMNALQARQINPMVLKKDPRGTPHWFVAENNSELYYVENAGALAHFRLSVFGNSIDGGEGRPVSFGVEESDRTPEGDIRKGSVLIQTTETLPAEIVEAAIRFIEGIEKAPRGVKDRLVAWISAASKK